MINIRFYSQVIIFIIIFFFQCSNLFAKAEASTTLTTSKVLLKIDSIEQRIIQIEKEQNGAFTQRIEGLQVSINQASNTINNQSSLITSFGVIYTILTIIITIIAIGIPIIVYQFGIKPSRDALRALEENLNAKVGTYLKETRSKQIKQSIEHLKGDSAELKSQAISFLSITFHEGFTDQELFEFYSLLKSGRISSAHKITLVYLLSSRKNPYADELFVDKEQLKDANIKATAIQYITKVGIDNFVTTLKDFIKNSSNSLSEYFTIVYHANQHSQMVAVQVLNNKELVDCINETSLKDTKQIQQLLKAYQINITIEVFWDTYFAKKATVVVLP